MIKKILSFLLISCSAFGSSSFSTESWSHYSFEHSQAQHSNISSESEDIISTTAVTLSVDDFLKIVNSKVGDTKIPDKLYELHTQFSSDKFIYDSFINLYMAQISKNFELKILINILNLNADSIKRLINIHGIEGKTNNNINILLRNKLSGKTLVYSILKKINNKFFYGQRILSNTSVNKICNESKLKEIIETIIFEYKQQAIEFLQAYYAAEELDLEKNFFLTLFHRTLFKFSPLFIQSSIAFESYVYGYLPYQDDMERAKAMSEAIIRFIFKHREDFNYSESYCFENIFPNLILQELAYMYLKLQKSKIFDTFESHKTLNLKTLLSQSPRKIYLDIINPQWKTEYIDHLFPEKDPWEDRYEAIIKVLGGVNISTPQYYFANRLRACIADRLETVAKEFVSEKNIATYFSSYFPKDLDVFNISSKFGYRYIFCKTIAPHKFWSSFSKGNICFEDLLLVFQNLNYPSDLSLLTQEELFSFYPKKIYFFAFSFCEAIARYFLKQIAMDKKII